MTRDDSAVFKEALLTLAPLCAPSETVIHLRQPANLLAALPAVMDRVGGHMRRLLSLKGMLAGIANSMYRQNTNNRFMT